MIDSNTSLPFILTPKHFLLFLRSVLRDWIQSVLAFQAGSWYKAVTKRFVLPRLSPRIQFVRLWDWMFCWEVVVKLVLGWRHRKLGFGLHVCKCMCGIYVFTEDRNILRSFLISCGPVWNHTCLWTFVDSVWWCCSFGGSFLLLCFLIVLVSKY